VDIIPEFASEGFDLDAVQNNEDAVLELGGKVSRTCLNEEEPEDNDPLQEADTYKQLGNDHFKQKEWNEAYGQYTKAIGVTPGITGAEILELQRAFKEEQQQKIRGEAVFTVDRTSRWFPAYSHLLALEFSS